MEYLTRLTAFYGLVAVIETLVDAVTDERPRQTEPVVTPEVRSVVSTR